MIISHHGHLEFGSPKVPMFPEALLLHYLDDLDSKMECMRHAIADTRSGEGEFTGYHNSLERPVLRKAIYLEGPRKQPPPAPPPPPKPAASHGIFGDKLRQALSSEGGQEG
jgi:3'-5' exoribonuclease